MILGNWGGGRRGNGGILVTSREVETVETGLEGASGLQSYKDLVNGLPSLPKKK